jgi:hypothetical protein
MKCATLLLGFVGWAALAWPALACSSHASTAVATLWEATGGGGGAVTGLLTLESSLVAPTSSTVCIAGVGLGSLENPAPPGLQLTGLAIVVVDSTDGSRAPLSAFSFAPDAVTTAALAAGSGSSSLPNTNPLFPGATWFGFSTPVDPFPQPVLGPGEFTAFEFAVEVPSTQLPVTLHSQFAGGEGRADGTPIFEGAHPAQYFAAASPFVTLVPEPASLSLAVVCAAICLASRSNRARRRDTTTVRD